MQVAAWWLKRAARWIRRNNFPISFILGFTIIMIGVAIFAVKDKESYEDKLQVEYDEAVEWVSEECGEEKGELFTYANPHLFEEHGDAEEEAGYTIAKCKGLYTPE